MYIKRHLEEVIIRISSRKSVVVLTGARQVGKSTMFKEALKNTKYVTMDRPIVRQSAIENPSLFFQTYKPPIIVDEIQKAGGLMEYIKEIVDSEKQKGMFYLTGSQSFKLMQNVTESLTGRAGVVKMLGLSNREIDEIDFNIPFLPTRNYIEERLKVRKILVVDEIAARVHMGSYPELYESKASIDDWSDFYSSYFQSYIEKDIKNVLKIHDESAFIRFVKTIASLSGEMLNYMHIAEVCGKDIKTIQSWISLLESSGLIYILQPYYNNFAKRLVKTPKLYFLDTGLACWLLGWNTPQQLLNGAMWGHLFETYVIAEIIKSYYNNGNAVPPLFYYRDKDKNEIDLVIEEQGTLYPVEIKAGSDPQKSASRAFRALSNIPGMTIGEGAVVCLAKDILPLSENVFILPVDLI